jgi:hypothetical protein
METQTRSRVAREEWARRVERWQDSGLTCGEFAAEIGVNPRTLTYWKWILGKEARGEKRSWPRRRKALTASSAVPAISGLVEVQTIPQDGRFELELGAGRRLRVPASFDAAELRRLLEVLEAS